jgi:hypothetical protein
VRAALAADTGLTGLLGSAAVFDEVPRDQKPPYLVLADTVSRDGSTATEPGEEHQLNLHAWSRQGGLKESLEIAARAVAILDDADLPLAGHRLVNLRWVSTEAKREPGGRHRFAQLRFRAVTEPL